MDPRSTGIMVAIVGAVIVVIGLAMWAGALGWFGRLPGDFRFGDGNVRVYVPLASMLLISLALSLLLALFRR